MKKRTQVTIVTVAIVAVLLLIFGARMFYIIQPGEKAVVFKKFGMGLDKDNILSQGFHMIAPWNEMIKYDVREQKSEETMDVLDKEGLSINLDVTVVFNPIHDRIGYLHENIGKDFVSIMVIPNVRASVRTVTGRFSAEEIYSTKRPEVEQEIIDAVRTALAAKNIDMKDLLIRSIVLPEKIKNAIESKLQFQQEAQAYQFRNEGEKMEAERRRIEAEGIANYNRIISASLTNNILKQKGIDATLELAKSENSKIVVIGSSDEGLPLILGNN